MFHVVKQGRTRPHDQDPALCRGLGQRFLLVQAVMKLDLKITKKDLEELQQDLEDAAADYGQELARLTLDDVEGAEEGQATTVKESAGPYHVAESNFQKASEKLRRGIELFVEQNQ
jgi:hypothetical protein